MSNTQSKSVLQRAVGGIFLLGLIALIAVLLLQPSDKIPSATTQANSSQKPTLSITAHDPQKNTSPSAEIQGPTLVLESETNAGIKAPQPAEIIGEDIWQSVEQNSASKTSDTQITGEAIVMASVDAPLTRPTINTNSTPEIKAPAPSIKPQEKPKAADKPKVIAPKLELISDTASTPKPAQSASTQSLTAGKWYVQLGAFSNSANAQKLMTEFKQKGYNVRIQKDNQINRVQIGPYATKKEAEQVQSRTKGGSLNPSIFQAK